jgi:hypothetical protein
MFTDRKVCSFTRDNGEEEDEEEDEEDQCPIL